MHLIYRRMNCGRCRGLHQVGPIRDQAGGGVVAIGRVRDLAPIGQRPAQAVVHVDLSRKASKAAQGSLEGHELCAVQVSFAMVEKVSKNADLMRFNEIYMRFITIYHDLLEIYSKSLRVSRLQLLP